MLSFSLVCVLFTVCYGLFALPLGVIGRLCSITVAIHGHYLYSFSGIETRLVVKTATDDKDRVGRSEIKFNPYHKFSRRQIGDMFLIFHRKHGLSFMQIVSSGDNGS